MNFTLSPRVAERREAVTALAVSVVLFVVRFFIGFISGSLSVLTSAIHDLGDAFTSILVYVASYIASRPPDREHPYGHGKVVNLAEFSLGSLLIVFALYFLYESIVRFVIGHEVRSEYLDLGVCVLLVTVVVKEVLARWAEKLGKLSGSLLCKADAWHHRLDALIGLGAVISLYISASMGLPIVDIVFAIAVVSTILYIGLGIARRAISSLIDEVVPEIVKVIESEVMKVDGVVGVHDVRIRNYGGYFVGEVSIHVRSNMTVDEAHEVAHRLIERVRRREPRVLELVVHVEPGDKEHE